MDRPDPLMSPAGEIMQMGYIDTQVESTVYR